MAAPLFPVNVHRYDPYRTFKFQVLTDGQVVAGLSKMTSLKKKTDPVKWRVGGDSRLGPSVFAAQAPARIARTRTPTRPRPLAARMLMPLSL